MTHSAILTIVYISSRQEKFGATNVVSAFMVIFKTRSEPISEV